MHLHIHTLGSFHVYHGDTVVPDSVWKTQKNKLFLKILLTFRGHALTKEQLIEWLWPHLDPAAAARNLRVAVSQVRQLLEPDLARGSRSRYILTTESGYAWNPEAVYWLDAVEFERGAQPQSPLLPGSRDEIPQLQAALDLYRGDYLEEDRYADWAIVERERLRELRFTLLTRLAEASAGQGRYHRAIALCREVLAADGCRESVWCQLMLYHYHAGDQNRALLAYEECRQTLAIELDVEPLPETTALAQEIRRREVAGPHAYPPPVAIERLRHLPLSLGRIPFVGREIEYAELVNHLAQTAAGRGQAVLIEGEAGVGKTRLAEEVVGYARQQGFRVLEGRCWEEGGVPYQPILDALRPELRQGDEATRRRGDGPVSHPLRLALAPAGLATLAELLPDLRLAFPDLPDNPPLPPEQQRARLFEALTQLLLDLPAGPDRADPSIRRSRVPARPLLFLLDDLHWADASTLEFLTYCATRFEHESVLILGALRSEEVAADEEDPLAEFLWVLKRRRLLRRVTLGPLSPQAVARLLQTLSRSPARGALLAQRLYRETEGNPLFLLSVLQALFEDGLLTADEQGAWSSDAAAIPDPERLPPTVQQVILHRLERLGDEERQVLEAAAVLGREFQWKVLAPMRSWRRDVLLDHLDRLMQALLVHEQGHADHVFSHDKIRQVVYAGIAEERRGWLHRKAGESLEALHAAALDEVAGTLAYHFQQAGLLDKAFGYHLKAGWHATRLYANAEAIGHYRSAVALVGQGGFRPAAEDLREAHERLGDVYQAAGHYARAQDEFEDARRHASAPADRVRLLYKLAHNDNRQGHSGPSVAMLRAAVDEVDRLGADQVGPLEAARVYARWAIMGSGRHGSAQAEHYARQAVTILERQRPEALQTRAPLPWDQYDAIHSVLINAGEAFRHWERWREAADLFDRSLIVAEHQGDLSGIGFSCHNRGDVVLAQGDFAAARSWYERAAEAWARSGETWVEMAARTHLGLAWACEGRWQEARDCLEQARTIGERMAPTEWLAEVYLWLSLAELHRSGDAARARAHRERAAVVAEAAGQTVPDDVWHLALSAAEARADRLEAARQYHAYVQELWAKNTGRAFYSRWLLAQCRPAALPDG